MPGSEMIRDTAMVRFSIPALLACALAIAGCGGSNNPPDSGGSQTIRGNERIGWDQQAASASELAGFRYAIYVDGNRGELPDVTCANTAGSAGFACSGRLPGLSPGDHTLELASYVTVDGAIAESPKSAPLRVTVSAGLTAPAPGVPSAERPSTSRPAAGDGRSVGDLTNLQTRVEGLNEPVDFAIAADGRIFVAIVVMALVTSLMAAPLMSRLLWHHGAMHARNALDYNPTTILPK